MGKRPVIGVTGPEHGGFFPWIMAALALWRAGGRAKRVRPGKQPDFSKLQGVVLGGGSDVAPVNYGEEFKKVSHEVRRHSLRNRIWSIAQLVLRLLFSRKRKSSPLDPERDEMEMAVCRHALDRGLPVLGICRGAQLLNIVLGGTLYQDTSEFYEETPNIRTVLPRKQVNLVTGSRLARALDTTSCFVNSLHHQAVKELGQGMLVTASEPNSVVQGIEHEEREFLVGVQWHPEFLPQIRRQQGIFRALVRAAKRARKKGK